MYLIKSSARHKKKKNNFAHILMATNGLFSLFGNTCGLIYSQANGRDMFIFVNVPPSCSVSVSPSGLGNDHLGANLVEPFPQVRALQVHAGVRRRAHCCGLRALQERVVALCCSGRRGDGDVKTNKKHPHTHPRLIPPPPHFIALFIVSLNSLEVFFKCEMSSFPRTQIKLPRLHEEKRFRSF